MNEKRIVTISKFLSRHLRHAPEKIGLVLDSAGWADVNELLAACARNHLPITRAELEQVVAENDKKRFTFDAAGNRIRASQGHSIGIELGLTPVPPPETLYHGTGERSVSPIQNEGLRKLRRDHVHLSADIATATMVGTRHGRPAIFTVAAGEMYRDGFVFYRSENGVWLTDAVPPRYLSLPDAGEERGTEKGKKGGIIDRGTT